MMTFRNHSRCICSPNPWDETNRDSPVHRPGSLPWGIDLTEIHRGGY